MACAQALVSARRDTNTAEHGRAEALGDVTWTHDAGQCAGDNAVDALIHTLDHEPTDGGRA